MAANNAVPTGDAGGISQLKAFLIPLKSVTPEPVVRFETEAWRTDRRRS